MKKEITQDKKVVMEKESCNCFTCRHKNEPRVIAGYLHGYIDASDWFINWAEKNKIKLGSIADDDLGGIYAQMKCNRDESGCLLEDFPDLENKKDKIEEFTLQQVIDNQERAIKEQKEDIERLQAQVNREIHMNRKMKKALEKYADNTNWGVDRYSNKYKKWLRSENGFKLSQQTLKQIEDVE